MSDSKKVLWTSWCCSKENIGLVVWQDENTFKHGMNIGTIRGLDDKIDAAVLANNGNKITPAHLIGILRAYYKLDNKKYPRTIKGQMIKYWHRSQRWLFCVQGILF